MKPNLFFTFLLILALSITSFAQDTTGVTIGDTLLPPHPSAILELKSTAKGFLPTRLTSTQRQTISEPARGLLVFDTDYGKYFYYDTTWRNLSSASLWQQADTGRSIFYTEGKVGIGVNAPDARLHVAGGLLAHIENYSLVIDTVLLGMPVHGANFLKTFDTHKLLLSGIQDFTGMGGNDPHRISHLFVNLQNYAVNQVVVRESNVSISSRAADNHAQLKVDPANIALNVIDVQNNSLYSTFQMDKRLISLQNINSNKSAGLTLDSLAINLSFSKDSSLNHYLHINNNQLKLNYHKPDTTAELSIGKHGLSYFYKYGQGIPPHYFVHFKHNGALTTNLHITTDSSINASQYLLNGVPVTFGGDGVWNTDSLPDIFYNAGNVGIGTTTPQTKLNVKGKVMYQYKHAVWAIGDSLALDNDTINEFIAGLALKSGNSIVYNICAENYVNDNSAIVLGIFDTAQSAGTSFFVTQEVINAHYVNDTTLSGFSLTGSGLHAFAANHAAPNRIGSLHLSGFMSSIGYSHGVDFGAGVTMDDTYGLQATLTNNVDNINTRVAINPHGDFTLSLSNEDVNPTVDFSIANGWIYKGKDTTATMFTLQDSLERNLLFVKNNGIAYFKGNVGINITNPSEKLHVDGNILASGSITQNSDARLKTGITTLTNSLSKLSLLRGVSYWWKDKEKSTQQQLGLIAQEVEKIYPELVGSDNNGNKTVNYIGLIAPLIEAVKELKNKVETLESKVQLLTEENITLKAEK